jgi:hypothetical protein
VLFLGATKTVVWELWVMLWFSHSGRHFMFYAPYPGPPYANRDSFMPCPSVRAPHQSIISSWRFEIVPLTRRENVAGIFGYLSHRELHFISIASTPGQATYNLSSSLPYLRDLLRAVIHGLSYVQRGLFYGRLDSWGAACRQPIEINCLPREEGTHLLGSPCLKYTQEQKLMHAE